jgi:hypothetical protein
VAPARARAAGTTLGHQPQHAVRRGKPQAPVGRAQQFAALRQDLFEMAAAAVQAPGAAAAADPQLAQRVEHETAHVFRRPLGADLDGMPAARVQAVDTLADDPDAAVGIDRHGIDHVAPGRPRGQPVQAAVGLQDGDAFAGLGDVQFATRPGMQVADQVAVQAQAGRQRLAEKAQAIETIQAVQCAEPEPAVGGLGHREDRRRGAVGHRPARVVVVAEGRARDGAGQAAVRGPGGQVQRGG